MPNIFYQQLRNIIEEISPILAGSKINKIFQPYETTLLLEIYKQPHRYDLLISTERQQARFHLTYHKHINPVTAPKFCLFLRQHIENAEIEKIELVPGDRVVKLAITKIEDGKPLYFTLVVELLGNQGNVFLLSKKEKILGALNFQRKYKMGESYLNRTLLLAKLDLAPDKNFLLPYLNENKECPYNFAADEFYRLYKGEIEKETRRKEILGAIKNEEKKLQGKINKLQASLQEAEGRENYKIYGELLKSNLHKVKKGDASIELPNYFDAEVKQIIIPLDPKIPSRKNMELYFKRYRKLSTAEPILRKHLNSAQKELSKIEKLLQLAEEQIETIEIPKGLLKAKKKNDDDADAVQPRKVCFKKFISRDNLEILVGKGAKENDELTFRIARGNDFWMHTEDYPSSHVIVRTNGKAEIPQETLIDAAHLTAHFSKAKEHGKISVMYTFRKYVTKPKKAKPGLVMVAQKKTILLLKDEKRLQELLMQSDLIIPDFEPNTET